MGFQPQNMPRLAFPESVRAVVGSICRSGQVLGFGQNECKVKGNVNPTPRFSPSDAETMKMCENTNICIFGICPLCGGVNSPKWTSFYKFWSKSCTTPVKTPNVRNFLTKKKKKKKCPPKIWSVGGWGGVGQCPPKCFICLPKLNT